MSNTYHNRSQFLHFFFSKTVQCVSHKSTKLRQNRLTYSLTLALAKVTTRNLSFKIAETVANAFSTQLIKLNYLVIPHQHSTTISLETYPLIVNYSFLLPQISCIHKPSVSYIPLSQWFPFILQLFFLVNAFLLSRQTE